MMATAPATYPSRTNAARLADGDCNDGSARTSSAASRTWLTTRLTTWRMPSPPLCAFEE